MFKKRYLKDVVYGSIDGIITTFAVVSGVMGASLSYGIIVVLGLANLLADGFSMAIGNYLSTKSEIERITQKRKEFHNSIRNNPENEKEKLKEFFLKKGFSSSIITNMVDDIASNKEAWEGLVIRDKYGGYENANPKNSAIATFLAFVFAGAVPLFAFVFSLFFASFQSYAPFFAVVLTAFSLFMVGLLKAKIVNKNPIKSGFETLFIGGFAAFVAFLVGFFLKGVVS